ncbi:hypothetical protein LIER_13846 [Lithospermum erythrorhizon]|uniref:Uncharacterized protein n=1 Tax=Lithospermum erythrorhizon TaxID=34254 RepID=A0AAV3Q262_LITER
MGALICHKEKIGKGYRAFRHQAQAFELEKQKLKWEIFCSKKGREMEKERPLKERMELENERMKELELINPQHQRSKSDPSIITG